jgi:prepilin-type N-terminal cleavage/methylation domain-containing protein
MFSLFSQTNFVPRKELRSQAGFGLIELLISISIMVIITSVILVRHSSFNSAVLLRGEAYELALSLREVQLSAVSAIGTEGDFRSLQGIYFDTRNNGTYRTFKDADGDNRYDANEEFGQQGFLDSRFVIGAIRAGGTSVQELSVVFERPDYDARFFSTTGELAVQTVQIDVARRDATSEDEVWTIEITATGQIAVKSL